METNAGFAGRRDSSQFGGCQEFRLEGDIDQEKNDDNNNNNNVEWWTTQNDSSAHDSSRVVAFTPLPSTSFGSTLVPMARRLWRVPCRIRSFYRVCGEGTSQMALFVYHRSRVEFVSGRSNLPKATDSGFGDPTTTDWWEAHDQHSQVLHELSTIQFDGSRTNPSRRL